MGKMELKKHGYSQEVDEKLGRSQLAWDPHPEANLVQKGGGWAVHGWAGRGERGRWKQLI